MKVLKNVQEVRSFVAAFKEKGKSIGFVPTMGCLHPGHLSLVERSIQENDLSVVSIFVNPLQFAEGEDFEHYPRTESRDLELLAEMSVDMVFLPEESIIYPNGKVLRLCEERISNILCGAQRSGHFDGVLQVVLKLLNIVQCNHLYLGEKDYQQWLLIDLMVRDLFLDTKVIRCPIIREEDGLAMSSRNRYLTEEERIQAAEFPRILRESSMDTGTLSTGDMERRVENELQEAGFAVDYVRILNAADLSVPGNMEHSSDLRVFSAVRLGETRLIDNMVWRVG